MSTLAPAHKAAALAQLNDIAPDTFDEGEFGPWTFTDLTREGDEWTLSFDNGEADSVTFTHTGDCIVDGAMSQDWFEQINAAILEWESQNGDGDGGGDDE